MEFGILNLGRHGFLAYWTGVHHHFGPLSGRLTANIDLGYRNSCCILFASGRLTGLEAERAQARIFPNTAGAPFSTVQQAQRRQTPVRPAQGRRSRRRAKALRGAEGQQNDRMKPFSLISLITRMKAGQSAPICDIRGDTSLYVWLPFELAQGLEAVETAQRAQIRAVAGPLADRNPATSRHPPGGR
jgi:hypothetical protein